MLVSCRHTVSVATAHMRWTSTCVYFEQAYSEAQRGPQHTLLFNVCVEEVCIFTFKTPSWRINERNPKLAKRPVECRIIFSILYGFYLKTEKKNVRGLSWSWLKQNVLSFPKWLLEVANIWFIAYGLQHMLASWFTGSCGQTVVPFSSNATEMVLLHRRREKMHPQKASVGHKLCTLSWF